MSTAASFITSAVTAIAISRLVDPAEYGRVSIVMSSWGFLVVPVNWCGAVVARFGPVELEHSGRMSRTLGTRLLFAIPALAFLAILVPLVVAPWAAWSGLLVALTFAFLAVSVLQDLTHWAGATAQGFRAMTVANVLTRGLPALVVLAPLVIPFSLRAEHLLSASVGATAVGSAFLLYALRAVVRIGSPDRKLLRAMWRYIAPALVGVPAASLIMWVDPIVLSRFVSRSEVGHYQLAYLVLTVSAMAGTSLNAVLSPDLVRATARGDVGKLAVFIGRYQPRLTQVFGLAAFAGACVAEPVVLLVVGPHFAPSAKIAAILCVAAGFQMATSTMYTVVTATDGQAAVQTSAVLQAAVNVVGDVLLGSRFGAPGVAVANVVAWVIGGVSLALLLRRKATIRMAPWAVLAALAPFVIVFAMSAPPLWARFAAAGCLAAGAIIASLDILRDRTRAKPPSTRDLGLEQVTSVRTQAGSAGR